MFKFVTELSRSSKSPRVVSVGCLLYSTAEQDTIEPRADVPLTISVTFVPSYLVNSGRSALFATFVVTRNERTALKSAFEKLTAGTTNLKNDANDDE